MATYYIVDGDDIRPSQAPGHRPIASFTLWFSTFSSRLLGWTGSTLVFGLSAIAIFGHAADVAGTHAPHIAVTCILGLMSAACAFMTARTLDDIRRDHARTFVPGHRAWLKGQIAERSAKLRNAYRFTVDVANVDDGMLRHIRDASGPKSAQRRIIDEVSRLRARLDRLQRTSQD